jgi:hypothetical protein
LSGLLATAALEPRGVRVAAALSQRWASHTTIRLPPPPPRPTPPLPTTTQLELIPGGGKPPGPVGMLTVRLVRVQGLRSEDPIGQSDPYVVVQVGGVARGWLDWREGRGEEGERGS